MRSNLKLYGHDLLLILTMATLAACGLIYQYLLSHYAGRVLGVMEHAIFTMIGVMIVSMGVGAFAAKMVRCPYTGFAWLETIIALFGAAGLLLIGGSFALSSILPNILAVNYGVPDDLIPKGGMVYLLQEAAGYVPYIIGFIIGTLIGMEIPFIARVREQVYGQHLEHNVGTIYGADYFGAGAGAAIFIIYMLSAPPEMAAVYTAAVNLIAGIVFIVMYRRKIRWVIPLAFGQVSMLVVLVVLYQSAAGWNKALEDMLYQDQVVFSHDTKFQHITLTERKISPNKPPVYALYLNGRTQFSSDDEFIYHDMLVHPAMLAAARRDEVLVIGGGDGLALREVLKWNPQNITLLELDNEMVNLFTNETAVDGRVINKPLLELNNYSFKDKRVNPIFGDAYNTVDQLIADGKKFDVILVDLPDPSHPNLNKLYSIRFYKQLNNLLNGDGAIAIQSTSPYHARDAFLTVGVTLKAADFSFVERYHQNVPSFGQWGWTIATKVGASPRVRIDRNGIELPDNTWATKGLINASFEFGTGFIKRAESLEPNRLGTHLMYRLHQEAWMGEEDVSF